MIPVPIFLYHSVAATCSAGYRPWCVDPQLFDEHMHAISTSGYTPMTVSDYVDARSANALPARPCLVTFDDGRVDFIEGAVPALSAHRVPATMYMVTGHVGGTSAWLPMAAEREQPLLGWSELRGLQAAGVEIGAHSETHPELDIVPPARQEAEIAISRDRLSDGLGLAVRSFAYPHGYHSSRVVRAVRDAGYDSAVAVKDRWSHDREDRFRLARMFVWNTTTADDLLHILDNPPTERPRDLLQQRIARTGWRYARWMRQRIPGAA